MNIDGIGALVVGGASGLGEATARRLRDAGAVVTIADLERQAEKGSALAEEIGALFVEADVTNPDMVQEAVDAAAEAAGEQGLRAAINCAGIGFAGRTATRKGAHPIEPFTVVINVNLIGTFNVMRLAALKMTANEPDAGGEKGVIVNTASIAAFDGQIGQVSYSASKGGVVGMTLPAARDLAREFIRVNTIAPGLFDTPLLAGLPEPARKSLGDSVPHPARLGYPDEYGQLVCHIISNPMMNGETIRLDGALRMAPQ